MPFVILIIALVIVFLAVNIRVVPQAYAFVIERLGVYSGTWQAGLHVKIPFIDKVVKQVSLKEQVIDFKPQPVITRDNVTMQIDTVVFFQIMDPTLFTYGVERPLAAIENLTATTLRNIIGELDLDSTLTSRDTINTKITVILDEATDKWGIKVNRVEVKNIMPPKSIQDAMEKQMKAEREKREAILNAEGTKASTILVAEGEKESAILRAEGEKESAILRAEAVKQQRIREGQGEAEAIKARAEAIKLQKIQEGEGEALALKAVQDALAEAIEKLNATNPSKEVLTLRSFEALAKVADGNATKLIVPSDLQNLTGLIAAAKEAGK